MAETIIHCDTGEFRTAIDRAAHGFPKSGFIFFDVQPERVTLRMFNKKDGIVQSTHIRCAFVGLGAIPARFAVPLARLVAVTKMIFGDIYTITYSDSEKTISIKTDTTIFTLSAIPERDYEDLNQDQPFPRVITPTFSTVIEADALKRIASRTVFACSDDEFRPAMTGVLFEFHPDKTCACGTDGFRMMWTTEEATRPVAKRVDAIIPPHVLELVAGAIPTGLIEVETCTQFARFSNSATTIDARLIAEKYPDYERCIPNAHDRTVTINRMNFLSAIERISVCANILTRIMTLTSEEDQVIVASEDPDSPHTAASEAVPCTATGEPIRMGFNATFLTDILSAMPADAEDITMELSGPLRPVVIRSADRNGSCETAALIMPIRLNE